MKYNLLGTTGVLVSELCLGAMTFGGKGFWTAIGQLPQEEVTSLVKIALEKGINFIDTANVYSDGLSEIMLGKALRELGIHRQQVVIATKVRGRMGSGANQVGLSRMHILDSVDESLKRLEIEYADLLYIHGVDPVTPLEETLRGLDGRPPDAGTVAGVKIGSSVSLASTHATAATWPVLSRAWKFRRQYTGSLPARREYRVSLCTAESHKLLQAASADRQ